MSKESIEARIDELYLIDAAYHHQIDMKVTVSIQELIDSGLETITIDDPRTQNDLFRHIQRRLTELRVKRDEIHNHSN